MLFWLCASAPFLFLIISLFLGSISNGYSQQQTISSLVNGNYGVLQTLNFIVCGLLTLGLAYLIRNLTSANVRKAHLIKLGAWTLGASLLLLGLLPADGAGERTILGQVHGAVFIISVVLQAGIQIIFAISNLPSPFSISVFITGAVAALGLPGMFLYDGQRGIIQRFLVGGIFWWITAGALVLRRYGQSGKRPSG